VLKAYEGADAARMMRVHAGYNVVGRDSNAMQAEPSAEPPPSQPTNDARLSTWRAELPTEVVHGTHYHVLRVLAGLVAPPARTVPADLPPKGG
jgi:hypothetical protein